MEKKYAFDSETIFRRKLNDYVKFCSEDERSRRLPNAAGFCRYCSIRRMDYAALKDVYPLMYDIAESTFIDEALNTKVVNSGAIMNFIHEFNASVTRPEKSSSEFRLVCEHDYEVDAG